MPDGQWTPRHETSQSRLREKLKRYFGLDQPDRTWQERFSIFLTNERRAFARLIGSNRRC